VQNVRKPYHMASMPLLYRQLSHHQSWQIRSTRYWIWRIWIWNSLLYPL